MSGTTAERRRVGASACGVRLGARAAWQEQREASDARMLASKLKTIMSLVVDDLGPSRYCLGEVWEGAGPLYIELVFSIHIKANSANLRSAYRSFRIAIPGHDGQSRCDAASCRQSVNNQWSLAPTPCHY